MPENGHLVIYRKYRPRDFNEIVGQESAVKVLSNSLKEGRLAHAYLFSGPHGVGKTTVARIIAKAANCENAGKHGATPCNKCASCLLYNQGASLDLVEIDAASSRGIDEIRELRETVRYAPSRGGKKTYIIDEVHMLTTPAFNALLKTLEEPPEHAIFILATTEIDKVPATIISRTQHFEFRRPSVSAIAERLIKLAKAEKVSLATEAAHLIAMMAEGSIRDAESILGQIMAVEDKNITKEEVEDTLGLPRREIVAALYKALVEKNAPGALNIIRKSVGEGHDAGQMLKALIRLARSGVLAKLDAKLKEAVVAELLPGEVKNLETIILDANTGHLKTILAVLTETSQKLRRSPIPELPLELAALEISFAK
ncbi:MAG: DNA polymerase III subunit gamma/tau [Candidatus Sungbacteria bacterium]|nr:DNA polymerase III subunit gamma/tau [Candidatus Sungbacteria bacterium]